MIKTSGTQRTNIVDRRQFVKWAGAGASVGLAGCIGGIGGSGGSNTVKIGAIYPLTGLLGDVGQNIQAMINAAVKYIINKNQTGLEPLILAKHDGLANLNGAKVEVVWADHRGSPAQGRAAAERLIQQENVDMLYGAYNSSVTKTVSQAAERNGIPMVNGESSSPGLTKRGLDWFWRTGPHDVIYTRNMFQFFNGLNKRRNAGLKTLAIIHEDTEYGTKSAQVQKRLAKKHGYKIVAGPIAYTAKTVTSFISELQRIQAADPDIMLPTSYLHDAILMAQDMRTLGYFPPLVMAQNSGHTNPGFVKKVELSNYFCTRSSFADDLTRVVPELGTYQKFMKEKTGMEFNGVLIRSWGGFLTAVASINKAGTTDPSAVQETLNQLRIDQIDDGMPYGVKFNENGQNALASGMLIQYHDAKGLLIWPFNLAKKDSFTFPAPDWSER